MKRRNLLRLTALACALREPQLQPDRSPLAPPPGIPEPKFRLWQRVWCPWVDEYDVRWLDSGRIEGILWKMDGFIIPTRWCYWVHFDTPAIDSAYTAAISEEELFDSLTTLIADHDSLTMIR